MDCFSSKRACFLFFVFNLDTSAKRIEHIFRSCMLPTCLDVQ